MESHDVERRHAEWGVRQDLRIESISDDKQKIATLWRALRQERQWRASQTRIILSLESQIELMQSVMRMMLRLLDANKIEHPDLPLLDTPKAH